MQKTLTGPEAEKGVDAVWFERIKSPQGCVSPQGDRLPLLPDDAAQREFPPVCSFENLAAGYEVYHWIRERFWPAEGVPRILDFGAGWAAVSRFFLRDVPAEEIWLADRRPGFFDMTRRMDWPGRAVEIPDSVTAEQMDLPQFDLILTAGALDHITAAEFACWARWLVGRLKPGGALIFSGRFPRHWRYPAANPEARRDWEAYFTGNIDELIARGESGTVLAEAPGAGGGAQLGVPAGWWEAEFPGLKAERIELFLEREEFTVIRSAQAPVFGRAPVPRMFPWTGRERICHIHAGIHKTGSTAIQEFMHRQRDALKEKGIHVCEAGSPWRDMAAHHNLAYEACGTSQFTPAHGRLAQLTRELKGLKKGDALISSEEFAFAMFDAEACERLSKAVTDAGFTPNWIVYHRSFPDWADSAYAEICKSLLLTVPLRDWWDTPDGWKRLRLGFHPHQVISGAAGRGERVDVRSYHVASKIGLMADFQRAMGIDEPVTEAAVARGANDRAQSLQIEWFRLCAHTAHRFQMMEKADRHTRVARRLAGAMPASAAYSGLDQELAGRMREKTEGGYRMLHMLSGMPEDFATAFPQRVAVSTDFHAAQTPEEWRPALFRALALFMDPAYHGTAIPALTEDFFTKNVVESV